MNLAVAATRYRETAPSARSGLTAFLAYCQVEDTTALRMADAVEFLQALVSQHYSPETILRYETAINGFFRWLCAKELVSFSAEALQQAFLAQGTVLPRRVRALRAGPEEGDARSLLEAAYAARPASPSGSGQGWRRHLTYLRNIAIVEMLRATGARPGELVALRRGDMDEENQVARAPDGRLLYFDLASWAALPRYLEARRDPVDCPPLLWQAPIFARHDPASAGQGWLPLVAGRVGTIVKGLRSTETVTARALRTRFGQRVLAATADEKGTARLLGIKGLPAVRRYRESRASPCPDSPIARRRPQKERPSCPGSSSDNCTADE